VARYLGRTSARWLKLKPIISQFFSYENSRFTQKKLQEIFVAQSEPVEKNRENGRKGANAKHRRNNNSVSGEPKKPPDESPNPDASEALVNRKPYTEGIKPPSSTGECDDGDDGFFLECRRHIVAAFPHLEKQNCREINRWQEAGYSFEKHIKPTVDFVKSNGWLPGSFEYFTAVLGRPGKPIRLCSRKVLFRTSRLSKSRKSETGSGRWGFMHSVAVRTNG
jgi:hypothetical protein